MRTEWEDRYRHEVGLYRCYDMRDCLLYVGIAKDIRWRMKPHSLNAPWFLEVTEVTVDYFPDEKTARKAERDAIRLENPLWNRNRPGLAAAAEARERYSGWVPPLERRRGTASAEIGLRVEHRAWIRDYLACSWCIWHMLKEIGTPVDAPEEAC